MSVDALPFGIAHHMALVPLAWLAWSHRDGERIGAEWWWIASAFAVSWLADSTAHWVNPAVISIVYPVSQAAIIGAVLLTRDEARGLAFLVAFTGLMTILAFGIHGPDVLLRVVAWGTVAGLVWNRPALGRLRLALLVTFGVGLLAWMGYALAPGWTSWGIYQSVRALGIVLFCWASANPRPLLRVVP